MQKLFNMEQTTSQGSFNIPWWTSVQSGLKRNLEQVITHYRRFPNAVNSSHFLIKLITNIGIYRNASFEQFCETVFSKAMGSSMSLGVTSSLNRGVLFDGVFYGKGVKEIIVGTNETFNIYDAQLNWHDLEPIRVLSHPKSDLELMVPDGTSYSVEEGVAVISINLPMLALQYREFRLLEDKIAEEHGESPRSIMQFLYAYPLNNMLRSHLDCALFNRLYNTLLDVPFGYSNRKHPFQLVDYTDKINEINAQQIQTLGNNNRKFDAVMKSIPLVSADNLQQFSTLPSTAPTRQVIWALALSRLQLLSFLFRVSNGSPRKLNGMDVNQIVRAFELWHTDKALKASLPLNLYFDYREMMKQMISS
jgi:hypothetical protein